MSVSLMARVWELNLSGEEQQVMLALADHAHDDGTKCHPGVRYLSWKTGKSERSVQYVLRGLEASGLIVAVAYGKGGRGHAKEYRLHLEKGAKKAPFTKEERVQPIAGFADGKGAVDCTLSPDKGCNRASERVQPVAPQPSITGLRTPDVVSNSPEKNLKSEGARDAPRAAPEPITGEFIESLVIEFAPRLGGPDRVRQIIGRALNHKASDKWKDKRRGLRDWLTGDVEKYQERMNGTTGQYRNGGVSSPNRTSGAARPGERPITDADRERLAHAGHRARTPNG